MRLNRLKLVGRYKSIVGTEQQPFIYTFKSSSEGYSPICLVGLNGSGKSNFIELIADIFGYADRYFNPQYECAEDLTYDFEIDYQTIVDGHDFFIKIKSINSKVKMYSYPDLEYIDFLSFGNVQKNRFQAMAVTTTIDNEYDKFLPDNVLAYSSGNNQGLSSVFAKTQYRFFDAVRKQGVFYREYLKKTSQFKGRDFIEDSILEDEISLYIKKTYLSNPSLFYSPPNYDLDPENYFFEYDEPLHTRKPRLPIGIFSDYSVNQLIFVSLTIMKNSKFDSFISDYCGITALESFDIDFRLADYRELDFIQEEVVNRIFELSSDTSRFNKETLTGVLSFSIDDDFYDNLERLYLEKDLFFQNLLFIQQMAAKRWSRDEKSTLRTSKFERNVPNIAGGLTPIRFVNTKVRLNDVEKPTLYDRLSDGEHQLIQIIGSLILFENQQSLLILDEPESHFNPEWRIEFINIINDYVDLSQLELIVSTHSPFVLSACKSNRVLHFKKDEEGCVAIQSLGSVETYGASFDSLLASVFDLDVLISKKPLSELRAGLRAYDEGLMDELETLKWLESYGDSFEVNFRRNQIKQQISNNDRGED